ncbi:aminoglycoside phosphotransferase family protein [Streptomyces kaniharaensis]|uniref:Aminoglycoside phosphotransferase family protein n=1 Tax=Streptomyces kaniharaensis TaxID=212423 RepID=A0A6N7KZ19_9ACTN|nr:aminoglycoside phosphotransferase family protein [Streptomyces kaniharaensis]MQS15214.1 aminoglycoside phosphotransferase family protein [Streptomyces kaniharaensis]
MSERIIALPGPIASLHRPLAGPLDALTARRLARQLCPHDPPALQRPSPGYSDVLVLRWDGEAGRPLAVKHPRNPRALASLTQERDVLLELARDERLRGWRSLVPESVDSRLDAPLPVLLQGWLPGAPADALLSRYPQNATRVAGLSLAAIRTLHRATGRMENAGDRIDDWIGPRLDVITRQVRWCRHDPGAAGLAAVERRLRERLAHRPMLVAWIHGDFAANNVLLSRDGGRVTGLVDWAGASPDGPSEVDVCTFALALRWLLDRRPWGRQVVGALRTGSLVVDEVGAEQPADIVLLTWLWHVAANLEKSRQFARNRGWLLSVVVPVLEEAAGWP